MAGGASARRALMGTDRVEYRMLPGAGLPVRIPEE